jgi:hypothetical protein
LLFLSDTASGWREMIFTVARLRLKSFRWPFLSRTKIPTFRLKAILQPSHFKYMTDAQIFQILGLCYLAVGVGMLVAPKFYQKLLNDYLNNPPAIFLGGFMALIIGCLLVAFHNVWNWHLTVIITLVGWGALIKGLWLLVLPESGIKLAKAMLRSQKQLVWLAIIITLVGALLLGLGWTL